MFQYMGCLIMGGTASPSKTLACYKQIGCVVLSRLMMRESPEVLVGPAVIRLKNRLVYLLDGF